MADDVIDATGVGASWETWRRRLASMIAIVAAVLLIALVALVAVSNRDRDAALARERHSYEVMIVTRALDASMARSEAALGRFVISGDRKVGTIYYDEWKLAGRLLRRLRELTLDNPDQQPLVDELTALYVQRGRELAKPATRANFRQGWPALSMFNEAGKAPTIPRIARLLTRIAANERALLGQRSTRAALSVSRSNTLAAILSGLGLLLVLAAAALGWLAVQAIAQRHVARRAARAEADRAHTLEQSVADRTHELQAANQRLHEEMIERAAAEAQLRQVQKMEAIGQLTGGIAHDFNNMLAVVVGALDLAKRRLAKEAESVDRHLDNALEGANRAAALTRRLLAFARAEPLLPEHIPPNALIAGMSDLLDRTLGERIEVETHAPDAPWHVWIDAHQLENAILNLAVNARDAMDGEGRLVIATENVVLRDREVGEAPAGDYVCIRVEDDGCGMPPEVLEHVFEPFFTTKPVGKGTGLGLSQIFGFARQSGGEVDIRSTVGSGTVVSLYLPRARDVPVAQIIAAEQSFVAPAAGPRLAPGAAVLVVEDDPRVRLATVSALEELGYSPMPCQSGEEAIALLGQNPDLRLVITDVVMPGMTGPELVARITPAHPDLAVLFVTGYVGETGDTDQLAGHEVLRKPFTIDQLAAAVAAALVRNVSGPRPWPRAAAAG